jgi:hypothetical protein
MVFAISRAWLLLTAIGDNAAWRAGTDDLTMRSQRRFRSGPPARSIVQGDRPRRRGRNREVSAILPAAISAYQVLHMPAGPISDTPDPARGASVTPIRWALTDRNANRRDVGWRQWRTAACAIARCQSGRNSPIEALPASLPKQRNTNHGTASRWIDCLPNQRLHCGWPAGFP